MSNLRILDTGLMPAGRTVAMTAALVDLHGKGGAGDLIRFHRYPRACCSAQRRSLIVRPTIAAAPASTLLAASLCESGDGGCIRTPTTVPT